MTLTEIFILLFATGMIVSLFLTRRDQLFRSLPMLLLIGVFVCTSCRPVLAAPHLAALGASDNALNKEQKALDESLRLNPEGTLYTGVESVQQQPFGQKPNDTAIKKTILSDVEDDLVVEVTNGSVQLTGRVEDKQTAQDIVARVKQIPGVQEITFSLGLEKPAVKVTLN